MNTNEIDPFAPKLLKNKKKLGWRKFCSHFNSKTPISEVWSLVQLFKKRKFSQASLYIDEDLQSQLNNTITKLCPPSCLHVFWKSLNTFLEEDLNNPLVFKDLDSPFTTSELSLAINKAKVASVPGLDQIDYNVITSLPLEYNKIQIYNYTLESGSFPSQWYQFLVVLIPKPGNNGIRPPFLPVKNHGKNDLHLDIMVHIIPSHHSGRTSRIQTR